MCQFSSALVKLYKTVQRCTCCSRLFHSHCDLMKVQHLLLQQRDYNLPSGKVRYRLKIYIREHLEGEALNLAKNTLVTASVSITSVYWFDPNIQTRNSVKHRH